MRGFGVFTATLLVLGICCTSATAWEFSMRGEGELRYRYISRTGPNDLFGDADYAQRQPMQLPTSTFLNTSVGLAGANNKFVQVEGYSSKGSDAGWAEQRFQLFSRIRVNKAIDIKGIMSLQGNLNGNYARQYSPEFEKFNYADIPWAAEAAGYLATSSNWATNPHHSGWIMVDSRDIVAGVGMAAPIVNALWYTVQTPWGTLVYGRRPAGFGPGWVVHRDDVYARSLSFIVPYGPLTIVFSQYLHDTGEDSDPNNELNVYDLYWKQTPNERGWPFTVPGSVDKNKCIDWNQSFALVYRTGAYDLGALARIIRWSNVHSIPNLMSVGANEYMYNTIRDDALGPGSLGGHMDPTFGFQSSFLGAESVGVPVPGGTRLIPVYGDMFFLLGIAYLKYQSARFFFNGEYDFQLIEVRRTGGRPISGFPQAWMVETGFLAGPMKLSLAHFYRSGHDCRHGRFYPAARTGSSSGTPTNDKWELFLPAWGGGQAPIEPYNFLIGLYGAGNNSFNSAGNCTYTDFLAYAARLDYAVAANLNVFTSIIHAERASNTGWHRGDVTGGYYGRFMGYLPIEQFYSIDPLRFFQRPNVPDNDLGLEIDVGMRWKLLENFTFKFRFAYWQPGNWFKWVYVDHSRRPGLACRANPGRTIDPLIGFESSLLVEF